MSKAGVFVAAVAPLLLGQIAAAADPAAAAPAAGGAGVTAIWWLLGAAGAAALFNQVAEAWQRLSGKAGRRDVQQPLEVKAYEEFQRLSVCQRMHEQLDASLSRINEQHGNRTHELRHEIKADFTALSGSLAASLRGVHERVDTVLAAVSEVRGELKRIAGE